MGPSTHLRLWKGVLSWAEPCLPHIMRLILRLCICTIAGAGVAPWGQGKRLRSRSAQQTATIIST